MNVLANTQVDLSDNALPLNRDAPRKLPPLFARCVKIILAIVLLAAAGLKAYQLFVHSDAVSSGLLRSPAIISGLIQAEFLLALWLIIGGFPRIRFVIALVSFGLFFAAASYEAFHALPSCGCFGNVKVAPAITAVFDALALIALWFTRSSGYASYPGRLPVIGGAVVPVLGKSAVWAA